MTSLIDPPKRVLRADIDGDYFDGFQYMIDNLYRNMTWDEMQKPEIKIIEDRFKIMSSIDRWNIKDVIPMIEKLHKISKTDLSVKWLKFLKRYKKQFTV